MCRSRAVTAVHKSMSSGARPVAREACAMRLIRQLAGIWGPIGFCCSAYVAARVQPGYSHRSRHVSGLAARGQRSARVMIPGFLALGVSSLLMPTPNAALTRMTRMAGSTTLAAGPSRSVSRGPATRHRFRGDSLRRRPWPRQHRDVRTVDRNADRGASTSGAGLVSQSQWVARHRELCWTCCCGVTTETVHLTRVSLNECSSARYSPGTSRPPSASSRSHQSKQPRERTQPPRAPRHPGAGPASDAGSSLAMLSVMGVGGGGGGHTLGRRRSASDDMWWSRSSQPAIVAQVRTDQSDVPLSRATWATRRWQTG